MASRKVSLMVVTVLVCASMVLPFAPTSSEERDGSVVSSMTYSMGQWGFDVIQALSPGESAWYFKMAIDDSDTLHVSYVREFYMDPENNSIYYASNQRGVWDTKAVVINGTDFGSEPYAPIICVDASGSPHIVFTSSEGLGVAHPSLWRGRNHLRRPGC